MSTSEVLKILVLAIVAVLAICAFLFSVFGNFVVICVMTREKKLRKKSNLYIISVAVADLLIGIFGFPFSAYAVN